MHTLLYPINLIELDTVDSTQNYLKKIQSSHNYLNDWVVVWALNQTKGQGTYGNYWEGEKAKNLTFSFSLQTYFRIKKNLLNICICNGIHKRLSLEGEVFSIKWPNDILLNGQKIAGIIIDNQISKGYIQRSIIGIGLNVHQEKFETVRRASSLKNILNKTFILKELLISLLKSIQEEYYNLIHGEEKNLKNYYLLHLFRKGQKKYFKIDGSIYKGQILGIDKYGRLIILFPEGIQKYFSPKEIDMIY